MFGWCGVCNTNAKSGEQGFCKSYTKHTWGVQVTEEHLKVSQLGWLISNQEIYNTTKDFD